MKNSQLKMQIRLHITKTDPELRNAASEPTQQTAMHACPAGQRVSKILPDGTRKRATLFSALQSH